MAVSNLWPHVTLHKNNPQAVGYTHFNSDQEWASADEYLSWGIGMGMEKKVESVHPKFGCVYPCLCVLQTLGEPNGLAHCRRTAGQWPRGPYSGTRSNGISDPICSLCYYLTDRQTLFILQNVVCPASAVCVAWHTPGLVSPVNKVCVFFIMNAPRAHLRGRQELRSTTSSLYCNHSTQIIGSIKVSWYGNVWHAHLHDCPLWHESVCGRKCEVGDEKWVMEYRLDAECRSLALAGLLNDFCKGLMNAIDRSPCE